MRVYEKVRAYIVDNGLEQAAVAQKAGIPNEAFTAILSGKKTLYAEELRVICIDYARQEFNIPRPENTWSNLKDEEYRALTKSHRRTRYKKASSNYMGNRSMVKIKR